MNHDDDFWTPLVQAAEAARAQAYAPYSNFCVGAALYCENGAIVAGCNVENVAFPSSQCAEASAIGAMVSQFGRTTIQAVVVASLAREFTWPCGNCRQMLAEFASSDCQVLAVTASQRSVPVALARLLPHAFAHLD